MTLAVRRGPGWRLSQGPRPGEPRMSSVLGSFPETQDQWDVHAEADVVTDRDPDAVRAI